MVLNIVRYFGFTKKMHWLDKSAKNTAILYTPLVLLILFLIGYLTVGLFGRPDLVMGGILFGGSIFVYIILGILYYFVDAVMENRIRLEEAEQASSAKTIFFSNMSHDIRTPLNAIIGYSQLAQREDATPEEIRGFMAKIASSGKHLQGLVNDVLEMSRIESGKMELEPAKTDLRNLMSDAEAMFEAEMEERQITFSVDASGVTDRYVYCDRNRFNRILQNLLGNACKFTPEGGTVAAVLRQEGVTDGTGNYVLTVRDTGIGMSREFAERVFDAFERERNTTVSGIHGTGLGMAITKNIVDLMGGTIEVDSEPGKGTVFTVHVGFRLIPEGEMLPADTSRPEGEAEQKYDFKGLKLLLAEDNEVNREIAALFLTDAGFLLDTAENGKIAADMVAASAPGEYAAVLMDIQMPVMNGYDATKLIRSLPDPVLSSVPIIAMTANAFQEDIQMEEAAGMNAHVSKPVEARILLQTLQKILERP